MGPLSGIRVVEMAGLAPCPFGGMLLADLGAEVIRVQRGDGGFAIAPPGGPLDRGKTTITLDIRQDTDRAALLELVAAADVFLEGNRPGACERRGIGPDELLAVNPRLIYGRMTGWGQTGPLAHTAGHDINYIALSGALGLVGRAGEPPVPPANMLADFAGGGMLLALGVLSALWERERSGVGQVVDASMVEGSALLTTFMHGMRQHGLWNAPRGENILDGAAPFYDTYACSDGGFVAVGCVEPQFFSEMLRLLEIDETSIPGQLDFERWPELRGLLTETFATRSRDEWAELFDGTDACVSPVLSPWEAHAHPHNVERASFVEVDSLIQPAPAPRFSRSEVSTPTPERHGAEDVRAVLSNWGVAVAVVDQLVGDET